MSKDTLSSTIVRMILYNNFLNVRGDAIKIFPRIVTSARHIQLISINDEIFLRIYLTLGMCFKNQLVDVIKENLAAFLLNRRSFNETTLSRQNRCFYGPMIFLLTWNVWHDAGIKWAKALVSLVYIYGGLTNRGISWLSLNLNFQMVMPEFNLNGNILTMEAFGITFISEDEFFTLISLLWLVKAPLVAQLHVYKFTKNKK